MGGSPPRAPKVPPQDNSMMMALLQLQQTQFAASQAAAKAAAEKAAEEQKQSLIRAEDAYAAQRDSQSETSASETLSRLNTQQELSDEAEKKKLEDRYAAEGMAATGGGYDYNKARQEALGNLGAASPYLSATAANLANSPSVMNPAMTTINAGATGTDTKINKNVFSLPTTQGLTFGGS
jgi:hypothetical protein